MDWKLFFMALGMLFVAELGDKTQLTVFTLVAQYKKPLPIFLGASAGLVLVTLIGALFGNLITKYVPAHILQFIAGILFVGMGIFILHSALPEVIKSVNMMGKN